MMKITSQMNLIYSRLNHPRIFKANEIKLVLNTVGDLIPVQNNKRIYYYNIPVAFDIETSSFMAKTESGEYEKRGIMYIWTLSIYGLIVQGRTWEEFVDTCNAITEWYGLNDKKRMCIYVHNLSYEFQFIHKHFNFIDVFSLKTREPVRALTSGGLEFRCSYLLSGYSLATVAKNLTYFKIEKLVGDLDYSLIRHSKTKITDKENQYCINDVQIIIAYITEYINQVKFIYNIPMTKTGVVRKLARENCFYGVESKKSMDKYKRYRAFITKLTINEDEYIQLKKCFSGGFTHANALYVNQTVRDVHSMDFTSSYPTVMIAEQFPMSKPEKVIIKSENEFRTYINKYCCFFDIEIYGLQPKHFHENYIQYSHCRKCEDYELNNGRVVSAGHLILTITELDFRIIEMYYTWDCLYVSKFYKMRKGYLPDDFVSTIVTLYENKTKLKNVKGKELEYLNSKELLNSLYGMTVTDPCRDEIIYNPDEWKVNKPELHKAIEKNNTSLKRFLYYPWGVWVTAYARYNLFTAISELGDDYIYSDTDSVKFINYEKHEKYFRNYNSNITRKLDKALLSHRINPEMARPKTIDGKVKQLGVWDYEGCYMRFKTLGAKRYMTEKNGKISITVSGLNKDATVPYLINKYGDKVFDIFKNGLHIPPEYTGKLTHTYIDFDTSGYITDYKGVTEYYHELSSIHLQPADYTLSMDNMFIKYLLGIEERTE